MSAFFRRVNAALARTRAIDEYVVIERRSERALRLRHPGGATTTSTQRGTEVRATVYRDLARGRGSTSFLVDPAMAVWPQIDRAAARAERAEGPAWTLPPPSAPARVEVQDPRAAEPGAFLAQVGVLSDSLRSESMGQDSGSTLELTESRVMGEVVETELRTSRGFHSHFTSTWIGFDALLGARERVGAPYQLRRWARRVEDLRTADSLASAALRMADLDRAATTVPGQYLLLLTGSAIAAHGQGGARDLGWFTAIVAQADALRTRQSLSRYRPGQSIYGAFELRGEPLTLISDGTRDHGLFSRPFGELGEAVRRFELVRDGIARTLALNLREAALLGATANGGALNLEVPPGRTPITQLRRAHEAVLELVELAWFESDANTGGFTCEIALGYLHRGEQAPTPITGGTITGNVFERFASARYSLETMDFAFYRGPAAISLGVVRVR